MHEKLAANTIAETSGAISAETRVKALNEETEGRSRAETPRRHRLAGS